MVNPMQHLPTLFHALNFFYFLFFFLVLLRIFVSWANLILVPRDYHDTYLYTRTLQLFSDVSFVKQGYRNCYLLLGTTF